MRMPICKTFGIEFPIFAFSHCRDVVAAVSRAGGLGVLGALAFSSEQLEIELKWIDEHADGKPYGVDVIIASGTEAGGHTGEVSTMVLVPEVVDAVTRLSEALQEAGEGSSSGERAESDRTLQAPGGEL